MAAVGEVEAVALPERLGAGQHLTARTLQCSRRRRGRRCRAACRRAGRRHKSPARVRRSQPPARGRRARPARASRPPTVGIRKRSISSSSSTVRARRRTPGKRSRGTSRVPLSRIAVEDLRRRKAHIPADSDDVCDAVQRDLDPDLFDDVGDIAAEKGQLDVVAVALQVELLAYADGAEGVDARVGRLAAPQQRETLYFRHRLRSAACGRR